MVFQSSVLFTHFCLSLLNSLSLISLCQCVCVFTVCPSNHAFCSKGKSFLYFPHLMSEHQELKQSPRGSLQMIGFLFKLEEFPHLWQNNGYHLCLKSATSPRKPVNISVSSEPLELSPILQVYHKISEIFHKDILLLSPH